MIVDDQYENRFGIRQVLELHQFLVVEAENGYSALKILEEQKVDLILSDVAMPNMNGYQLFERVRMNPDWLLIPFIFLTARSLRLAVSEESIRNDSAKNLEAFILISADILILLLEWGI